MSEDLNELLARACRAAATEQPSRAVDDYVLRAARWHLVWRRRRQLVPLAVAAGLALAFVGASNLRRHETTDIASARGAADPVTVELLRLQPPVVATSPVTELLLSTTSAAAKSAMRDEPDSNGE